MSIYQKLEKYIFTSRNVVSPPQDQHLFVFKYRLVVFKEQAVQYSFNASSRQIRVCGDEILFKMCKILRVWFGWTIFPTTRRISQPHELGSIYRLLHGNHVQKMVLQNTTNIYLKTYLFSFREPTKFPEPFFN